jgi:hypothetical protein
VITALPANPRRESKRSEALEKTILAMSMRVGEEARG